MTKDSDPRDHPLVLDKTGVYGTDALDRLRQTLIAAKRPTRTTASALTRALREREDAIGHVRRLKRRVQALTTELDAALAWISAAELAARGGARRSAGWRW